MGRSAGGGDFDRSLSALSNSKVIVEVKMNKVQRILIVKRLLPP